MGNSMSTGSWPPPTLQRQWQYVSTYSVEENSESKRYQVALEVRVYFRFVYFSVHGAIACIEALIEALETILSQDPVLDPVSPKMLSTDSYLWLDFNERGLDGQVIASVQIAYKHLQRPLQSGLARSLSLRKLRQICHKGAQRLLKRAQTARDLCSRRVLRAQVIGAEDNCQRR